jgi:hypothetical protein
MVNYEARINYVVFVSCAMGPISMLGSGLILLTVYRTKQIGGPKAINTYHRLLSGIAIFDMILSFAMRLGPLMIPSELEIPGAHGTTATCSFQGFLIQVGMGSFSYSASLMVYYVLVLRFKVRDTRMVKYFEPWLHGIPLLFHFATGILGFFWEIYNPQGIKCWVGTYPPGCEFSQDDDLYCERGEKYQHTFGLWFSVYPTLVVTGIIVICLCLVVFTVYKSHRASQQHVFRGSSSNRTQQDRIRLVVTQCLLYGFFFLNVTFWGSAALMLHLSGGTFDALGKHFWWASISMTLFPLQGLFYFLIFSRPRYLSIRRRSDIGGRWQALKQSVWEPEAAMSVVSMPLSTRVASSSRILNQNPADSLNGVKPKIVDDPLVESNVTNDAEVEQPPVESTINGTAIATVKD